MYPVSVSELVTHYGPMTRTVRDTAAMLQAMAGPDPRDPHCLPASNEDYLASCEGGVKRAADRVQPGPRLCEGRPRRSRRSSRNAVKRFEELGATVVEANARVRRPDLGGRSVSLGWRREPGLSAPGRDARQDGPRLRAGRRDDGRAHAVRRREGAPGPPGAGRDDGPLLWRVRPAADPDHGGHGVRDRPHRAAVRPDACLEPIHLSVQPDRRAGHHRSRRLGARTGSRSVSRSSGRASPKGGCCGRPPPSRPRSRG